MLTTTNTEILFDDALLLNAINVASHSHDCTDNVQATELAALVAFLGDCSN